MSTGTYGLPTLAPRLDVVYGGVSCPSTIVILKLGNYFSNADQRAFCTLYMVKPQPRLAEEAEERTS